MSRDSRPGAGIENEFAKRNTKIVGISVDPVESHHKWKEDIQSATGGSVGYPMIGDPDRINTDTPL